MARFKFIGIGAGFPAFARNLDVLEIRTRGKDGQVRKHKPKDNNGNAKAKFDLNDVITVTDEREIRHLRADPRFQEV